MNFIYIFFKTIRKIITLVFFLLSWGGRFFSEVLGDKLAGLHLKAFRKVGLLMSSDEVKF
jgi:hypothetical protein